MESVPSFLCNFPKQDFQSYSPEGACRGLIVFQDIIQSVFLQNIFSRVTLLIEDEAQMGFYRLDQDMSY
jgi:hypothetical protein